MPAHAAAARAQAAASDAAGRRRQEPVSEYAPLSGRRRASIRMAARRLLPPAPLGTTTSISRRSCAVRQTDDFVAISDGDKAPAPTRSGTFV